MGQALSPMTRDAVVVVGQLVASGRQLLALLPDRVRPDTRRPDDDF